MKTVECVPFFPTGMPKIPARDAVFSNHVAGIIRLTWHGFCWGKNVLCVKKFRKR